VGDHSANEQAQRSAERNAKIKGGNPMKTGLAILLTSLVAFVSSAQAQTQTQTEPMPKLIGYITLPDLEGWMDHMAVDVKGQRLFVPAEHKKSIEVVDLRAGKVIHSITGFDGAPRKTLYLPDTNQIWVDDGASVKSFSADSYALIKNIPFDLDKSAKLIPDNGAFDPATGQFYVTITADANSATATVKGSVEIVDTKTGQRAGNIKLDGTDPSGIAFDAATPRMFVILGDTAQVQVIDRDKRAIIATWEITGGTAPHTVAIDTAHHRLFVGARVKPGHIFKPGKMVVMDTDTGKVVAALDTEGGADEIQYDAASQRVYFTGTTGHVDVFKQLDADHYQHLGKLVTAADAKTSLLVPELKRFYVGVPKRNVAIPPTRDVITEDAELLVFEVP
jgi:DNA-binding beta-propeller fold protein YncE